jgi:hypothetical protein
MQTPSLLQRAKTEEPAQESGAFKRPNVKQMVPPKQADAVDRVVAAGMRYIYSPDMKQEVMAAVQSQEPMAQKLGSNVAGLILTLDNQSQGGIPVEAMFPAAVELLGESAEMMVSAGQPVTQEDFNTAALLTMAILAKKLGASDQDITAAVTQGQPGEQQPAGEEPMDDEMPEDVA